MSSVIDKMIGKHDVLDVVDKRFCWAVDISDQANIVKTTSRPFAAADDLFSFYRRLLLADSSRWAVKTLNDCS